MPNMAKIEDLINRVPDQFLRAQIEREVKALKREKKFGLVFEEHIPENALLHGFEGQVDMIYIDPPYNSGARDWKYNNDYVDKSDQWRHSKWLSFMQRRLHLARRLLRPNCGVLAVTVDEHEVHHLGILLDQV